MKQIMKIQNQEVWVHLGCSPEEQKFTQPVLLNFEIQFENGIKGSTTDRLEDAIDYVEIMKLASQVVDSKKFNLLESLCFETFCRIEKYLKLNGIAGVFRLSAQKMRVPVEHLKDGVVFSCEARL